MLQPARRKFRKEHKGRNTGVAPRGDRPAGDRRPPSRDGARPGPRGPRTDAVSAAPGAATDKPAEAGADASKPAVKRVRKAPAPTPTDAKGE